MSFAQMKMITHDTNVTPNQGSSVGSQGVQTGGKQTRAAAAAAKAALLKLASTNLGVPVASLTVDKGVVSGGGKTVTYGALIGDKLFNTTITGFSAAGNATTPAQAVAGSPGTKPVSQYKIVGTSPPRVDIPDKVTGKYTYVHNIQRAGDDARPRRAASRPGRVRRRHVARRSSRSTRARSSTSRACRSSASTTSSASSLRRSTRRSRPAAQLKVKCADPPVLPGVGNLWKGMRDHDSAGKAPARIAQNFGNFDNAFKSAAFTGEPDLQVPLHRPPADRPVVLRRRRDPERRPRVHEHAGRLRHAAEHQGRPRRRDGLEGSGAQPDPPDVRRGRLSVYGSAPYRDNNQARGDHVGHRRASRCASSSCAGTSTGGTTTARPR